MPKQLSQSSETRGYTVNFFKRLCDDSGHECRAPQGTVRVQQAETCDAAIEIARKRLARRVHMSKHVVASFEVEALAEPADAPGAEGAEFSVGNPGVNQGPGHDV